MAHVDLHAYCGADSNFLAWWSAVKLPGCLGYAARRRIDGGTPTPLLAYVPFSGSGRVIANQNGQPSTVWPFQRFTWSDFAPHTGRVEYQVVAMTGRPGALEESDHVSDWVEPEAPQFGNYIPFFNFGTVSSRWFSTMAELYPAEFERLRGATGPRAEPGAADEALQAVLKLPKAGPGKGGPTIADELGGKLADRVKRMLADAKRDASTTLYAALFELSDPDLIQGLAALGPRCNLILANGTHENHEDENARAAAQLEGTGVALHRRMLSPASVFAHNKFVVIVRDGTPEWAWTGSTNWTSHGLYTQSNNGLEVRNPAVAQAYYDQWQKLLAAGDATPPGPHAPARDQYHVADAGVAVSVFFSPHPLGRAGATAEPADAAPARPARAPRARSAAAGPDTNGAQPPDLAYANALVRGARQGILSLMLDPGWEGSLLQTLRATAQANPDLYVRGVVNTDPSMHAHDGDPTAVDFLHGKEAIPSNYDIVLPSQQHQAGEPIEDYLGRLGIVVVHSKIIVVDPLGQHPVVMTGSHNMGVKAATKNDDNLIIVEGDRDLAMAYALNVMSVFNHFWWRHNLAPAGAKKRAAQAGAQPGGPSSAPDAAVWTGLRPGDDWQDKFYADPAEANEARFWGVTGR